MRMVYSLLKFFLVFSLYCVLYWLWKLRMRRRTESYHPISSQPMKVKDKQKEDKIEVHGTHLTKAKPYKDVKIEIHGRLTQEMIVDILTRLSVKSLIRFSTLSKGFNTLLQSPNFIVEHLHFSKQSPSLLLRCCYTNDPHFRMRETMFWYSLHLLHSSIPIGSPAKITNLVNKPLPIDNYKIHIEGSSNGLLCFTSRDNNNVMQSIFLWNPATRQVKRIPNPSLDVTSFSYCSFGFTSTVNDYKVVLIQHKLKKGVEVYSLKIGAWTHIDIIPSSLQLSYESFFMPSEKVTTTNGSTFGVVVESPGSLHTWIICFDLGMATFSKINMPSLRPHFWFKLVPYEDSIALLVTPLYTNDIVDLWVHNNGGNYWTKQYSVTSFSQGTHQFPLTIWKGEVVITKKESDKKFLICTSNGIEKKIVATHEAQFIFRLDNGYDYVESLVLI